MEDLEHWQAKADAQMERIGADGYAARVLPAFPTETADRILAEEGRLHWGDGYMAHHEGTVQSGRRICRLAGYDTELGRFARDRLFQAALEANADLWNLPDLAPMPLAHWNRYDAGGFITWHEDTEPGDPRVLTVICPLRQERDEDGLMLNGRGTVPLRPGEAVVFPAYVFHRVPPVAARRDSLTLWITSEHRLDQAWT